MRPSLGCVESGLKRPTAVARQGMLGTAAKPVLLHMARVPCRYGGCEWNVWRVRVRALAGMACSAAMQQQVSLGIECR